MFGLAFVVGDWNLGNLGPVGPFPLKCPMAAKERKDEGCKRKICGKGWLQAEGLGARPVKFRAMDKILG